MVGIRKIGINTHIFGVGGADALYPAVLDDGNTVAWFDADVSYITKDGADLVSQWDDKSGEDNHLLQATGTNQPLWTSDGVLFDGIDNIMKCAAFTLNQPEFIYAVLKQITWGANKFTIFDGNIYPSGRMFQTVATPDVTIATDTQLGANSNLLVNNYSIVRALFNGASSKIQINDTAVVTGDAGTVNMGGFTIGARGDGIAWYTNIEVKEIIIRKIADASGDESDIYDYLKSKYSL